MVRATDYVSHFRPIASWGLSLKMRRLRFCEKVEFVLSPKLSIRVYADSRPHFLQTARLQKGGILVFDGMELVEEGLGFGAPVCLYEDGARFSLDAVTFVNDSGSVPTVVKVFTMNAIESKKFRRVLVAHNSLAHRLLRVLEIAYRRILRLQVGATMMLDVLSMMGLRNEYVTSLPKGQICVTYEPKEGWLQIKVDFRRMITDGLQSIVIGNEQGGRMFAVYNDSCGERLEDKQIEPWRQSSAGWASLSSAETGVGFKLQRPCGWRIVRGREVVRDRISWSGLNLVCDEPSTSKTLAYRIEAVGG